ncbi:MAG: MarR family winged helix-turn-helix transcriptional regulator [Gaiellales bacterium]
MKAPMRVEPGPASIDCYCANLRMATRAMTRIYDAALRPAGLRTTQFSILSRLEADGPLGVSRLAERLAMDRTTLAREVGPLVAAGLVERTIGADRRQRRLALTRSGRARLRKAWPLWTHVQRHVGSAFGEERAGELVQALRDLVVLPDTPGLR